MTADSQQSSDQPQDGSPPIIKGIITATGKRLPSKEFCTILADRKLKEKKNLKPIFSR
jgi:hypothetical protein